MGEISLIDIDSNDTWQGMITNGKFRTVIEFYTPWCRESQMMLEVMSKMRGEFPGIFFCRYNMDKLHSDALILNVTGVPSILMLIPIPMLLKPNGGPVIEPLIVEHIKGFISADTFREKLKTFASWERV